MPPLLSEEDINSSRLAVNESSEAPAQDAAPISRLNDGIEQAIDELRRDLSEIKGQVFPLRIDIARLSSGLKRTIIITGIAVVLVMMSGAAGYRPLALSSMGGVNEPEKSTDGSLTALSAEIEQLRTTMRGLKDRLERQAEKPASPEKPASSVDCAKLPADAKTTTVDFSIQFPVGSASISTATEATLDSIAQILALAPDRCILIEGHSDATGKEDKNLTLSMDRAKSVANYIADKGNVPRDRLVPLGKGSSSPATDADLRAPQNRRVVFKVVSG